jgi:hypothetical protein
MLNSLFLDNEKAEKQHDVQGKKNESGWDNKRGAVRGEPRRERKAGAGAGATTAASSSTTHV